MFLGLEEIDEAIYTGIHADPKKLSPLHANTRQYLPTTPAELFQKLGKLALVAPKREAHGKVTITVTGDECHQKSAGK